MDDRSARGNVQDGSQEEPSRKKQKRASDRITVDVGGTKFITSRSTLTANSAYFESLLSDEWDETKESEVYLDQDPDAFAVILEFMRCGMIRITKIDPTVLLLAEFLRLEKLLLSAKVRWYCAIGIGPVLHDDEEIAAAFDSEHRGIAKAISDGHFNCFVNNDSECAEFDHAVLKTRCTGTELEVDDSANVFELPKGGQRKGPVVCDGLIAALNYLYANGYSLSKEQIDHDFSCHINLLKVTFCRKSHSVMQSSSTDIFIPASCDKKQNESKYIKQFALYAKNDMEENAGNISEKVVAPAVSNHDPNSCGQILMTNEESVNEDDNPITHWLEENGFLTRERDIEDLHIFKEYLSCFFTEHNEVGAVDATEAGIYSRQILRTHLRK